MCTCEADIIPDLTCRNQFLKFTQSIRVDKSSQGGVASLYAIYSQYLENYNFEVIEAPSDK